jgi:calcineurin-like phosphoesterase family protein
MLYFTSDTHFGHHNILRYCNRPFDNIDDHDNALVDNWCSVVKKGDTVYHLGDFGYTKDIERLRKICNRLTGNIVLIRGNHDTNLDSLKFRFQAIKDTHLLSTKVLDSKVRLFLSHYPHRTWQHRPRDCYHLYGHVHGNMGSYGLSFDVGVDCWHYRPISIVEVHSYVKDELMPTWNSIKQSIIGNNSVEEYKL